MTEAEARKFKCEYYGVEGSALNDLWRISERLNDGSKLDPNERRDLAQRMQAILQSRTDPISWP